jgi:hypothetical protein
MQAGSWNPNVCIERLVAPSAAWLQIESRSVNDDSSLTVDESHFWLMTITLSGE